MKPRSPGKPLREIAALLGCAAPSRDVAITGVAALDQAGPEDISFLNSETFLKQFQETRAGAVLVQKNLKLTAQPASVILIVDEADLALGKVLELFAPVPARPKPGVDPLARIDPTARIGANVAIGAFVLIGAEARIGDGTVIHPHVYIGEGTQVGAECEIHPHVTLREGITIGSRVIVHAGSVLGSDGFGYRWDGTKQAKIRQIGSVIVEDDVEIGACVCVDRAKIGTTRIGRGTKIDNLVQVAHNVTIGPHCIIVGQAGLAGSATLGTRVTLGGQVALRDHVTLGDGVTVAACGAVANDVPPDTVVSGMPALPHRQSLREQAALRRLPDLVVQVRKLQEDMDKLRPPPPDPKTP